MAGKLPSGPKRKKTELKLLSILKDWSEWTSMPGPIQLTYALNTFTRVLWAIIWLGAFAVVGFELDMIVRRFLQFPADINDALLFGTKRFPVLTICNNNPLKLSSVNTKSGFAPVRLLMEDYVRSVRSYYGNISNDHFGINRASSRFAKERFVRKAQMLLTAQLPAKVRREGAYTFEEMVQSCSFNGRPCHRANFSDIWDPVYGACFQFNKPSTSNFRTLAAGRTHGLRLQIAILQTDPATGAQLYLPTTTSAGIRLAVEMSDVALAMEDSGLTIGVGREESISLKNTVTRLMKEPYGRCRNGDEEDVRDYYRPNFTYVLQNCLRSCRQDRTIRSCGCADPRYAKPQNASYCTLSSVFCLLQLDSDDGGQFSPIRDCGCRPACVDLLNSAARFPPPSSVHPPKAFRPPAGLNPLTASNTLPLCGTTLSGARCAQWMRQNSLVLSVWFSGLDYVQHTEQPAYSILRASNELGGQMALWLGVSFISFWEVAALLLMIGLYFLYGRKVRTEPNEAELNRDWRHRAIQDLRRELDIHERIDERLKAKIHRQHQERRLQLREKHVALDRAVLVAQQLAERAHAIGAQAAAQPQNLPLAAEAANAQALAAGAQQRIHQLREHIEVLGP